MTHVFISYSNRDQIYAQELTEYILSYGFDVWIDNRINFGDDWWESILQAIRQCTAFIVIMSPDSDDSKWVQREVGIADHLGKQIFPLLLSGDIESSKHWLIFVRTQYLDLRKGGMPSLEFIDQLSKYTPRRDTAGSQITSVNQLSTDDVVDEEQADEIGKKPIIVEISSNQFQGVSVGQIYQRILKFLVDNQSIETVPLPFASGSRRYLVANNPLHPRGNGFVHPISYQGYYMETHKSRLTAIKDLEKLMTQVGLDFKVISY
jgi:hypothetical protein